VTIIAYTGYTAIGAFQYDFADISVGGSNYGYAPIDDLKEDLADILDLEQPVTITWTVATWIPFAALNVPSYVSPIDKSPLGSMQIFAQGQARSEYYIQHVSQASGQYTFWLQDEFSYYPFKPIIGTPIGEVDSIIWGGSAPPLRGDSFQFNLQFGLEEQAVMTFEYAAFALDVSSDVVTSDFYIPGSIFV